MTAIDDEIMSPAEVRRQANRLGIPVGDKGRISAQLRAEVATAMAADPDPAAPDDDDDPIVIDTPDMPVPHVGSQNDKPPDVPPAERPPRAPGRRRLADRARAALKGPESGPAARKGKDKAPRRRVSLESLGGLAWSAVGGMLAQLGGQQFAPVTMMMAFQAPVAGGVIEDLARGTIVDKIAQPVARLTQSGGAAGALIGAPVATALICRFPHLYPKLRPGLARLMQEWVIVAGPKLREMKRREEKFAEEMGAFSEEFGMTVDQMLDTIFAPLIEQNFAEAAGVPREDVQFVPA
jgi:hypothetical protein